MPPKTQREREAEQRQLKLERMQEQVDEGSLVIRKMTDEERARFESARRDRPLAHPTPGVANAPAPSVAGASTGYHRVYAPQDATGT